MNAGSKAFSFLHFSLFHVFLFSHVLFLNIFVFELRPNGEPERSMDGFGTDILTGADEVSEFLFGTRGKRRRIYALVGAKRIPFFKIGGVVCARKSRLRKWIEDQEKDAA